MKTEINDKAHELGLKYFPNEQNIWARENIEAIYCSGACIAMAEWMQKQMIDKACEWLKENANKYIVDIGGRYETKLIVGGRCWEDLRKAMEE